MKIHIRYNGNSRTLDEAQPPATDEALLAYLQGKKILPLGALDVIVDRNPDGVVVRPPAVFG